MTTRILKKISTPFDSTRPDAAIIMVNLTDPQINTIKVFIQVIQEMDIPYQIVGNKIDKIDIKSKENLVIVQRQLGNFTAVSLMSGENLDILKRSIDTKFSGLKRVIVLGVFNSGKTSLINHLTGLSNEIGDIPGTTVSFNEYEYGEHVLIDSIGQLIDINKPLMASIDLSECESDLSKVVHVMKQNASAITQTCELAKNDILSVAKTIQSRIEAGNKIIVVGAGASALVAKAMAGQCTEFTFPSLVFTNDLSEMQPMSFSKGLSENEAGLSKYASYSINSGDCCIGISASGGTGFVYHTLVLAKKKGAITIAITENRDTPLGHAADHIITSSAKPEGPSSSRIMCAHLSICHAINILLADMLNVTADMSIGAMLTEKVPNKKTGIK